MEIGAFRTLTESQLHAVLHHAVLHHAVLHAHRLLETLIGFQSSNEVDSDGFAWLFTVSVAGQPLESPPTFSVRFDHRIPF